VIALSALLGRRVYVDVNVLIYALTGFSAFAPVISPFLKAVESGGLEAVTSELSVAELLVKPFRDTDAQAEADCRAMHFGQPHLALVPVNQDILIEAARLRVRRQSNCLTPFMLRRHREAAAMCCSPTTPDFVALSCRPRLF
jgi:hypothetical protein